MALNIYGVAHNNSGLEAIEHRLVGPTAPNLDTIYYEVMDLPPFTNRSRDKNLQLNGYESLITSLGKQALTIDGFRTFYPTEVIASNDYALRNIAGAAYGIFNSRKFNPVVVEDIEVFATISNIRDRLMAQQLINTAAGANGNDGAFVGSTHKPITDHIKEDSDIAVTFESVAPRPYLDITERFRDSSREGNIDPEVFITTWLLERIYPALNMQAGEELPFSEAGVRSVYREATRKPLFSILKKAKTPKQLQLSDVIKILKQNP